MMRGDFGGKMKNLTRRGKMGGEMREKLEKLTGKYWCADRICTEWTEGLAHEIARTEHHTLAVTKMWPRFKMLTGYPALKHEGHPMRAKPYGDPGRDTNRSALLRTLYSLLAKTHSIWAFCGLQPPTKIKSSLCSSNENIIALCLSIKRQPRIGVQRQTNAHHLYAFAAISCFACKSYSYLSRRKPLFPLLRNDAPDLLWIVSTIVQTRLEYSLVQRALHFSNLARMRTKSYLVFISRHILLCCLYGFLQLTQENFLWWQFSKILRNTNSGLV